MTTKTIEKRLLKYYFPFEKIMLLEQEYKAISELFSSVGRDPKDFCKKNNEGGRIQIENNSVVYLDLSDIGLNTLYLSIGNLKYLEWLYLSDNQIEKLPEKNWKFKEFEKVGFEL